MLRIKDIMTRNVYTVEADASAEEAAWGLTRRHIGGAPACDGDGNLVGVLSSSDLVNPEPAQWIRGEATGGADSSASISGKRAGALVACRERSRRVTGAPDAGGSSRVRVIRTRTSTLISTPPTRACNVATGELARETADAVARCKRASGS